MATASFTASRCSSAPSEPVVRKRWLVGPVFDLVLVSNLAWPFVACLAIWGMPWCQGPMSIVQVYFLSTPHRWITLALVFFDRDHFGRQPWRFGGLAATLCGLGGVLVWFNRYWPATANSLVLLMMVDYIWNAWHFAAQHAGIARIYGRLTRPEAPAADAEFEKSAIRVAVLWVFFRTAVQVAKSRPELVGDWLVPIEPWFPWADPVLMLPAISLLVKELLGARRETIGRWTYIASVLGLYGGQLLAIRAGNTAMLQAAFVAGAVFHAVEYLAVCTWSVRKKSTGVWLHVAPRTGVAMAVFIAVIGITNYAIHLQSAFAWTLLTLLVSLLHYAFDGMIWRSRPKTATRPAPA